SGEREHSLEPYKTKADSKRLCAWMLVTDTALITKRAGTRIQAYAVDMKAGTPVQNARVIAYREGSIAAEASCDSGGLANLNAAHDSLHKRLTIVAQRGEDEAVVGQNEYERSDLGEFIAHLYTERPVYRPGQRIYYKGIVRRNLDPGFKY